MLEYAFLLPGSEYTPASEVAQIDSPGGSVIEAQEYVETINGCRVGDFHVWRILGVFLYVERRATANDPKLRDRGVRRGTCVAGGKVAVEAGLVTHGAVRCSAWLNEFARLKRFAMSLGAG